MHANLIHNRFQILSELGSGGFGKVLKCRDMATNALVAIKVPLNEVGNELSRKEGSILERVKYIGNFNVLYFLEKSVVNLLR